VTDPWQKQIILNRRGQKLAALFCETKKPSAYPAPRYGPVVVVCHGFTGSKEGSGRSLKMGEVLAALGFSCLLFDFAGCGESEGQREEISLTRHIEDLSDVVRWCREAGFGEIILNGRSFGGAVALCYAAADKFMAGVCTWAAPAEPAELFRRLAGKVVVGPGNQIVELTGDEGVVRLRKSFFYDLEKHDVIGCVARISPRPLLVIHGTADEVVDPGDACLLNNAAGATKQLFLAEGADHRFSDHLAEVWRCFFDWLKNNFAKENQANL